MLPLVLLLLFASGCSRPPSPPEVSLEHMDPFLAETISSAQQNVRAAPDSPDAWGHLGQALEAAEFNEEALACYRRASQLDPASARWLHLLGLLELHQNPNAAFTSLSRAADLVTPTNDAPRLALAQALAEHGRFSEAEQQLKTLLSLNPFHAAARLELARLRLAANDTASAMELLPPALTNAYTARPAILLLSQVYQRNGNSTQAVLLARRAAAMPRPFDWPDPFRREVQNLRTDKATLSDRANSLMVQGRLADAEALLKGLLAKAPDDSDLLLLMGRLRFQQRLCAEACEILERHATLRPQSLQGLIQLGLAYYCDSRWADAAAAFRRALKLKPDFAEAHYNLGLALARAGDSTAAIDSFRAALRCQPGDAAAHAALAEELLRNGQTVEAIREADLALQINPRHPKALGVRQRALNQTNR